MEHIIAKLEELSELKAAADLTRLDYEARRAEILKAVQADLDELEAEYAPLLETASDRIAALEGEIRQDVLVHGASVKGGRLQAVYVRGHVSWDTKALDVFTLSHPEIARFRSEGSPSVRLNWIK